MRCEVSFGGCVLHGYEGVATAFRENFNRGLETGAAFAVFREGRCVVDLWGGVTDSASARPWAEDTLQVIFSGTKGLVSTCLLILIDRGLLDIDVPVRRYWPEFGKQEILVRDVLTHRSRLPGLSVNVKVDELIDHHRMVSLLEAQPPSEDPRAATAYHPLTFGWICGELVRRITGLSLGKFFREEIAKPLDLDIWIGLPAQLECRVAALELAADWVSVPHLDEAAWRRDALLAQIWGNPPQLSPGSFPWNRPEFHRAEIPGAGGIGAARSMAKLYDHLACGGAPIVREQTIRQARQTLAFDHDVAHREYRRMGFGFQLQTSLRHLGPPPEAFGHDGAGGSSFGAWPAERLGFAYAMNRMHAEPVANERVHRLLDALYQCMAAPWSQAGAADPS